MARPSTGAEPDQEKGGKPSRSMPCWSLAGTPPKDAERPPLNPGPVVRGSNWLQWVNEPQTEAELAALRESVARAAPSARPIGGTQPPNNLASKHPFARAADLGKATPVKHSESRMVSLSRPNWVLPGRDNGRQWSQPTTGKLSSPLAFGEKEWMCLSCACALDSLSLLRFS